MSEYGSVGSAQVSLSQCDKVQFIHDSVELCETEVCFLHIQLTGTNVLLPKIHKALAEVDFESSRSPATQSAVLCCASHMKILTIVIRVMKIRN